MRRYAATLCFAVLWAGFFAVSVRAAGQTAVPWRLDPKTQTLPQAASLEPFDPAPGAQAAIMGLAAYARGELAGAIDLLEGPAGGSDGLSNTAAFYLASARFRSGDFAGAASALTGAPGSGGTKGTAGPAGDPSFFLRADALMLLGLSLEAQGGVKQALARYEDWLALDPGGLRATVLLRAGFCASAAGDDALAEKRLRELVQDHPWTGPAASGAALAGRLYKDKRIAFNPDSLENLVKRARTLTDRRKIAKARELIGRLRKTPGADKALLDYLEGKLLYDERKTSASIAQLARVAGEHPGSYVRPWAMYHEAKGLWRSNDPADAARMRALLEAILREYPDNAQVREVSARHLMLLLSERGEFQKALEAADLLAGTAKDPEMRENAERLGAVLRFVLRDDPGAVRELSAYLRDNPDSDWADGARYFLGRSLERQGDAAGAAAQYKVPAANRPHGYYGRKCVLALAGIQKRDPAAGAAAKPAGPVYGQPSCPPPAPPAFSPQAAPLAVAAGALDQGGAKALACQAMEFAAARFPKDQGLALKSMALSDAMGRHMQAQRTAWRTFAACLFRGSAAGLGPVRDYVYPRKYAQDVVKYLAGSGADPNVVFGLIRQESFFTADAVSGAGAIGLMQVMPATAKKLAAGIGVPYSREKLFDPEYNIRLGTRYFLDKLAEYGRVSYALCSYNAGPAKINVWREHLGGLDEELFIELIPYTETRDYVKRILANRDMYEALYQ